MAVRDYMDRLLGRNEGSESRDFTNGRNYGEDQSFFDDEFYSEREHGLSQRYERAGTERHGGFFGKGPKGWKRSDERIKEEVSEALYRDYHIDASDIEVDVKDGIVTLSGTVDSRISKRSAEECIENLMGVVDIQNRIIVKNFS